MLKLNDIVEIIIWRGITGYYKRLGRITYTDGIYSRVRTNDNRERPFKNIDLKYLEHDPDKYRNKSWG